ELLHRGLLDGPLLGNQPVQRRDQPIHVRQSCRDGLLLPERWRRHSEVADLLQRQASNRVSTHQILQSLLSAMRENVLKEEPRIVKRGIKSQECDAGQKTDLLCQSVQCGITGVRAVLCEQEIAKASVTPRKDFAVLVCA